ncbi:MAG: hypothetical protein WCL28_00785 [bacterium]
MLKSQMIGISLVVGLVSCQKGGSSGGGAGPNVEADKKDEGTKVGSTDDGSEIAIVNLTGDLGACNSSRRGKSYYVLAEKKFRYCGDSDQWDVIDLKGSDGTGGAAGKNSIVLVTPEASGASCATGGQKIQNGLDQNANSQLDANEVTSTSYACNGLAGVSGADGKPSLVAVTAEAAGSNCASGGNKVRSGLDANSNGTLEDGEVQSTSFVCHGAAGSQGVAGAAGASGSNGTNGKNSLIKLSSESAGTNCPFGGKKLEVGPDTDSSGVLDAGEVSQTSYVCDGASLKLKKSDGSVVGQVISIFTQSRLDWGMYATNRQYTTLTYLVKSTANNAYAAYIGPRSSLVVSSWSGTQYVPSLDSSASPGTLKLLDVYFWPSSNYANYDQIHYTSSDCSGQAYIVRASTFQPDGDVTLFGTLPSISLKYNASNLIIMNKSADTWATRSFNSYGTPSSCGAVSTSQSSSPVQLVASSASEWPLSLASGWTIAP